MRKIGQIEREREARERERERSEKESRFGLIDLIRDVNRSTDDFKNH